MNIYKLFNDLKKEKTKQRKEKLLKSYLCDEYIDFFILLKHAYNPYEYFNISKAPKILIENNVKYDHALNVGDFLLLLKKLKTKELTGNSAKDALYFAAEKCDPYLWNDVYREILLKKLDIGLSIKNINSIILSSNIKQKKDIIIPEFLIKFPIKEKKETKKTGVYYIELIASEKRIFTILDKNNNSVFQIDTNGNICNDYPEILKKTSNILKDIPTSIVFDGYITNKSFNTIFTTNNETKIHYGLTDVILLDDFIKNRSDMTLEYRQTILTSFSGIFKEKTENMLFVIPKKIIDFSDKNVTNTINEYLKWLTELSYDACVIKKASVGYEIKKNKNWIIVDLK